MSEHSSDDPPTTTTIGASAGNAEGHGGAAPSPSLADAMWQRTRKLHAQAERSGTINDVLRGRASAQGYALLLRNLLPVYEAMEDALLKQDKSSLLSGLAEAAIFRAQAIRADVTAICGADWDRQLPHFATSKDYVARVMAAAGGDGRKLLSHAYTRYLGDLNGGQILSRMLARSLALPAAALNVYAFPGIPDVPAFTRQYRCEIDRAGSRLETWDAVLDEAEAAFRCNIAVSNEVKSVCDGAS